MLAGSDRSIAMHRRLLLEQIEKVQAREDPLGVIRDPEKNKMIELPQDRKYFGQGASFLAESMEIGHVRYSPLKDLVRQILDPC